MRFFELFHFHSKKRKRATSNPHDRSAWPKSWKTTYYKSYPRFKEVPLPQPKVLGDGLSEAIVKRRSKREYTHVLSEEHLSTLLFLSCGELPPEAHNIRRRVYASGGGRYPIETYVVILRKVGDINPGLYHYNVRNHSLTNLQAPLLTTKEIEVMFMYPETQEATCIFVFTAIFSRQTDKYGNRGYRHTLMEVGGISEHMGIAGTALGISVCPMSGYIDESIEKYLDVDGITESVVHTVIVG